jgi:hypothetical protein
MPHEPAAQSPNVPIALARAEQRRAMLERMADQGMSIAERLTARSVAPEIGGDILRHADMFAKIARGVRLAIILETKLDGQILAYRKGDLTALDEPAPRASARTASDPSRPARKVSDIEDSGDEDYDDDLVEGPEYDRLPTGGFRNWVEAICDDLGLDPDWSCWSDEEGFIRDDGRPVTEWPVRKEPESSSDNVSIGVGRLSSPTQPPSGEDRGRHDPPKGRPDG